MLASKKTQAGFELSTEKRLVSRLVLKTARHCSTGHVQHQLHVTDDFPTAR